VHARPRQAGAQLKQGRIMWRNCDILGPRYKDRQGGYIRIMKSRFRYGRHGTDWRSSEFVTATSQRKGAGDKGRVAVAEEAARGLSNIPALVPDRFETPLCSRAGVLLCGGTACITLPRWIISWSPK